MLPCLVTVAKHRRLLLDDYLRFGWECYEPHLPAPAHANRLDRFSKMVLLCSCTQANHDVLLNGFSAMLAKQLC